MPLNIDTDCAISDEELRDIALEFLDDPNRFHFETIHMVLEAADMAYHNGEESFIEDHEYDAIKIIASRMNPSHVYFTGVGSDVRGGKVKLPYEMGSLDQVEIGDIQDWVKKYSLASECLTVTDKMDGTSAMIVYDDDGKAQIAFSRGNGTEGADISRHIFKIKDVPKKINRAMVIRAEVEMTEEEFLKLRKKIKTSAGKEYKNARNMVAGIMNSSERPEFVYKHLSVIAYEIVGSELGKRDMLTTLEQEKFHVVPWSIMYGVEATDESLAKYLDIRRANSEFAIDGVVIDVESAEKRKEMNPTRDTLNPAYSIKYKVADVDNLAIATVKSVTWNISKHGYLKPQVNIEPVELVGVTVSNCTGFNARFIQDNGIGPGAQIQITRSGDVIPFCQSVVKPAIPQMPGSMNSEEIDWNWSWNETGVDAVLDNHHDNDEVAIQQTIDFFSSIEVPHLKEGNIRKMFEAWKYASAHSAISNMLNHKETDWTRQIGENGTKIWNGIRSKLTNIPLHVLMGSLPFFGRGVGKRKFKKLEEALGTEALHGIGTMGVDVIAGVKGFEQKTAEKIVNGIDEYYDFYKKLPGYFSVAVMEDKSGGKLADKKICMTGFRDKDLAAKVEDLGGTNQSGVSSKTDILVIKDPNSTSGKAKKARDLGVTIMGIDEFKDYIA